MAIKDGSLLQVQFLSPAAVVLLKEEVEKRAGF